MSRNATVIRYAEVSRNATVIRYAEVSRNATPTAKVQSCSEAPAGPVHSPRLVMLEQPVKNLLRSQALLFEKSAGRGGGAESFADVCLSVRDSDRQLYVLCAGWRRNPQAIFTADDEDMGLDDSSPMMALERASMASVAGVMTGFRVMMSCSAISGWGRFQQQPLFRVLEACKYAGIYPSISSHHFAESLVVKLLWSADDCDLY
jgi:hypothetical protein